MSYPIINKEDFLCGACKPTVPIRRSRANTIVQ